MKNIGNLFVRLFVISLLTFRYFPQLYPFLEPEPPRFLRLGLRLWLRANLFGGSGGSDSGSASLLLRFHNSARSKIRKLFVMQSKELRLITFF